MEKKLQDFFDEKLTGVTPGLKLQAYSKGELVIDCEWGKVYPVYDLASLTKIIFTTAVIMNWFDQKAMDLEDEVSSILNWYSYQNKIQDLLTHTAGNVFWLPIYQSIDIDSSLEIRFEQLQDVLANYKPGDKSKSVYSDIDFLILLFILETIEQKTISEIWDDFNETHYGDFSFYMNPLSSSSYKVEDFAPTENCPWRKKLMQGQVHDQNAWSLGGVSTHAGLFSDIKSLSQWGLRLREILKNNKTSFVTPGTLKKFVTRAIPREKGDWGLGFMLPTLGSASCGQYFSENSFGHTGFTGTSLWIDPENDWVVSILSNRVNISVESKAFPGLRGSIHDKVISLIKEKGK